MDDLVSTAWLEQQLGSPDLAILDASLFMPGDARDPAAEFAVGHIPGARRFDIEALSDPDHPAPHMLPGPAAFGAAMVALGVGRDDRIVLYDDSPLHSTTRGWYMLRHYGADRVAILDGGLAKRRAEGLPIVAPRGGIVTTVANQPEGAGHYVILAGSGERFQYAFMHLQRGSIVVREGQRVLTGQLLGRLGNTGASFGAHLHFEIWQGPWQTGGKPLDPLPYLRRWASWS